MTKQSSQMQSLMARYQVTTKQQLIRAIRDELNVETWSEGEPKSTLRDAETILDQMLEAEYQRQQSESFRPEPDDEPYEDRLEEQAEANVAEARKSWTEQRSAKDAIAYVAKLDEAMRTAGWGYKHYAVSLVSIDGVTGSGRQRFTVKFEEVAEEEDGPTEQELEEGIAALDAIAAAVAKPTTAAADKRARSRRTKAEQIKAERAVAAAKAEARKEARKAKAQERRDIAYQEKALRQQVVIPALPADGMKRCVGLPTRNWPAHEAPVERFGSNKRMSDGLSRVCRDCNKVYHELRKAQATGDGWAEIMTNG